MRSRAFDVFAVAVGLTMALPARSQSAQPDTADLAEELANPVAALISAPLRYNYVENYGANDQGSASRLNIQPVATLGSEK